MKNTILYFSKRLLLIILILSAYFVTYQADAQNITLNEFMSSNSSTIADEDGDFEDWIEIYNYGTTPVGLDDFGLSDKPGQPFKWVFPDIVIQPGEYLIVWASGKNRTDPDAPLHTNFSIKADGEQLTLTNPSGIAISIVQPVALQSDISYGRSPDGTGNYYFFDEPTPGTANTSQTFNEILEPPAFSHHGGFYTEDFTLVLSHPDTAAIIVYTLDGSYPDINNLEGTTYTYKNQYPENPGDPFGDLKYGSYQSFLYDEAITITDRSSAPDSLTQISSTWHQIPYYLPENPVFKGTVVRARALKPGALSGRVNTNTYFITDTIPERYSLPVISISIPEQELFDYENGIYVAGIDYDNWRTANPTVSNTWHTVCNFDRRGEKWEIPSHIELYETGNPLPQISQEIGIRIHGSEARRRPMKSLRLYARGKYGKSELEYKFFKNLDDNSFKRLLLRNSGQDFLSTMLRDATLHTIAKGLHFDVQEYEPAIVFINGEYWGIHNIRERFDKHYFERVYGVDPENIDFLTASEIKEGDTVHYRQTINYIEANGLADDVHYQYIKTRIDVDNFRDYQIANIFANNIDWPGANLEFWRLRTSGYMPNAPYGHDGRWRWMLYDMDFCFGFSSGSQEAGYNMLAHATLEGGTSYPNPDWSTFLLRKFLENEEFKTGFINRFADLLNTFFKPERVNSVINKNASRIEPEIPEHLLRWSTYPDISTWRWFLSEMRNFAILRPELQRQHIREYFDIDNDVEITLDVNNPVAGYIRINTINITNETPGVDSIPYPWTGTYFNDIPIEIEAVALPGYAFSHWEGINPDTSAVVVIIPQEDLNIKAHFIKTVEPQLLYFWVFDTTLPNDYPLQEVNARYQLPGNGLISYHSALLGYPFYSGHPNWRKASMERRNAPTEINYHPEGNNGVLYPASNMRGLQIKQPFTGDAGENIMTFHLPSPGYENLILRFAAKDEGAADYLLPEYSVNSGEPAWFTTEPPYDTLILSTLYQLYEIDLRTLIPANNNPDFKLRFRFGGSDMSANQGNRVTFNNISLSGTPVQTPNMPPVVVNPVEFQSLIENGESLFIDFNLVFEDPDNDTLIFTAYADNEMFVSLIQEDNILIIKPLRRGEVAITLNADDGFNSTISNTFRILIYPEAFQYSRGNYTFTSWSPDEPEYSYPDHMIFLQSDFQDPGPDSPLLFPYFIPLDDYDPDDQKNIGFPYRNTVGTRINGLGDDGISFLNTGSNRDLGGILFAVDTRDISTATISWLAGTLVQDQKIYALRLQYRTDIQEPFSDFLVNGQKVEYIVSYNGHIKQYEDIAFPEELLDKEYVQLLWRYYFISGESGSAPKIRFDDLSFNFTSSVTEPEEETISVFLSGNSLIVKMPADKSGILNIFDLTGRLVLNTDLNGSSNTINAGFDPGVYFLRIISGKNSRVKKIILGLQ
ncbi:MAG: CotH kinase family protein [Bacteroidales bacterium]